MSAITPTCPNMALKYAVMCERPARNARGGLGLVVRDVESSDTLKENSARGA